MKNTWITY